MATTNNMGHMQSARHRDWEDHAMMVLGIVIFLSSLFFPVTDGLGADLNIMLTGGVIAGLGLMEVVFLRPWEELLAFLAGLWTAASPYALSYFDPLRPWHVGLGLIVALLAATQMWQDRNRRFGRW